jgi:hypothetical protein
LWSHGKNSTGVYIWERFVYIQSRHYGETSCLHRTLKLVYISINELNSRLIHICKRPGKLRPVLTDYSDSKTGNFLIIMPFQVLLISKSKKS